MARAGQTEPDSVSIWLKLSGEDAARMTQVLARPEFAGWTRAEWCLEMIQTALGYYTRPRPAGGPGRTPAADATAEPAPAESVAPKPEAAEPEAAEPEAAETAAAAAEPGPAMPGPLAQEQVAMAAEPVAATAEPVAATAEPAIATAEPAPDEPAPDEPEPVLDEPAPRAQADCSHPADARDYQSGTCAACGAILWD